LDAASALREGERKVYSSGMSIAELKAEVDRLTAEERSQLRACLALKDRISDSDFLHGLAEKINDRNPERWVSIEEFEKRVG
jgi:hypothetical protein